MSDTHPGTWRLPVASVRRRPIDLSSSGSVQMQPFAAGVAFPLLVTPEASGIALAHWLTQNTTWIEPALVQHGALLFRGFRVSGLPDFERVTRIVSPALLEYKDRSTPRRAVGQDIYTSTEYPAHLDIVQHNENSYAATWPRKIAFYCDTPAATGGETPLADSREVHRRVSSPTRDLFATKGVMYVRNYGLGVDLAWTDAFQTSDRAAVEAYCHAAAISCEWLDEGRRLRTRQVRPAVVRHPVTGDWLWFNQAHLFHTSGLPSEATEALHAAYAEEDLPRQTFFGDGSPIRVALLDEVREAYRQSIHVFAWQTGDVLLLDNMLISHGRRAFTGTRRIYVAMADPWSHTE